jgi:hypothetical protein
MSKINLYTETKEDRIQAYRKVRKTWAISPVEKVKNSKKLYDRNREKNCFRNLLQKEHY